jgi:hypothetical protein
MKMIYFKSFVNVLFRSLQLKLPIHSYDINHAIEYCDNESPYGLELEAFIKAVCPHISLPQPESPVDNVQIEKLISQQMVDVELMKSVPSCLVTDSLHAMLQKKFSSVIGQKFKAVPSHSDLFFFCPPGLELGEAIRIGSRRRNETKSSESTSKHNHSLENRHNLDEEEDNKTVEFRSNVSSTSLKMQKQESVATDTDAETGQRDYHSNFSSASNFENDWDSEDEEPTGESSDELSPPLFVQFSFTLSQDKEDIVSVPVKRLPTCLSEIFQDEAIPDPEQDLRLDCLGLRLDIVCMTLPRDLRCLTENIGSLRSTSLCSTVSFRDSKSLEEDAVSLGGGEEEDGASVSDILSHLPAYQHKAVTDIKEELNWMLMDEIAFALCRTYPPSYQTLDFVSKHVQASARERRGSVVEVVGLDFVFGPEKSLEKFREIFGHISLHACLLKQVEEFYYIGEHTCYRGALNFIVHIGPLDESKK